MARPPERVDRGVKRVAVETGGKFGGRLSGADNYNKEWGNATITEGIEIELSVLVWRRAYL